MNGVYLDHNATTPLDDRVAARIAEVQRSCIGNPSSLHEFGRRSRRVLEDARAVVAKELGVRPAEVTFTSSATEANNLAIFGLAEAAPAGRRRIVVGAAEHPAVLVPCERLGRRGWEITRIPLDREGRTDVEAAIDALGPDVAFASLMWVNNETGVIQGVGELGTACRRREIPLHVDAVQALGKMPVDLSEAPIDLASFSAHKIFGPRGIGCLVRRTGTRIVPRILGGGQERERRAGTEDVASAAGFALAVELATSELPLRRERLERLERRLLVGLAEIAPEVVLNSGAAPRVPGTLNLRFSGIMGESLLMNLDLRGVAVSLGSACSSGALEPSHVLEAQGLDRGDNLASIRVSLGATNDERDVDHFLAAVRSIVTSSR